MKQNLKALMSKTGLAFLLLFIVSLPIAEADAFASDRILFEEKTAPLTVSSFARVTTLSHTEIQSVTSTMPLLALNQVKTYGKDGIESIRRKTDDFALVKAMVSSDIPVDGRQVWLGSFRH